MKNRKHIIFTIMILFFIWFCPAVVFAKEAPREEKEFTILVYMIGSNLESEHSEASSDISEMKAAMSNGSSDIERRVNLLVEYGGSSKWSLPELAGSASGHGRFEITGNGMENPESLNRVSMGSAATLSDFISYGITYYPAKRYILIFWNHGNGAIEGFGYDECYDGDSLELWEISEAFETSGMKAHVFALVGFDACLMGGLETACLMPENVEYMTASAAPEPLDGWDYAWISVLNQPNVSGKEISEHIADKYYAYYVAKGEKAPITIAAVNPGGIRQFSSEFGEAVMKQMTLEGEQYFSHLTQKRAACYGYDAASHISGRSELLDVQHLMNGLTALPDDERQDLSGLLENAVEARTANIPEGAAGMSVYVPDKRNLMLRQDCELYERMTFMEPYKYMVSAYYDYLNKGGTGRVAAIESVSYIPTGEEGLCMVLSDETQIEPSDIQWSAEGAVLTKNEQDYLCIGGMPVYYQCVYNGKEFKDLTCPVLYRGEPMALLIRVDGESGVGELLGAYPVNADGAARKEIGDSIYGEELIPLYPAVNMYSENDDSYIESDENVIQVDGIAYFTGESIRVPANGELSIIKTSAELDKTGTAIRITSDGQNYNDYY